MIANASLGKNSVASVAENSEFVLLNKNTYGPICVAFNRRKEHIVLADVEITIIKSTQIALASFGFAFDVSRNGTSQKFRFRGETDRPTRDEDSKNFKNLLARSVAVARWE